MNETTSSSVLTMVVDEGTVVPVGRVFVSIDLEDDVAYVAYEGESGIRWEEVARPRAELVARLGAYVEVQLGDAKGVLRRATSIAEGGCP